MRLTWNNLLKSYILLEFCIKNIFNSFVNLNISEYKHEFRKVYLMHFYDFIENTSSFNIYTESLSFRSIVEIVTVTLYLNGKFSIQYSNYFMRKILTHLELRNNFADP